MKNVFMDFTLTQLKELMKKESKRIPFITLSSTPSSAVLT